MDNRDLAILISYEITTLMYFAFAFYLEYKTVNYIFYLIGLTIFSKIVLKGDNITFLDTVNVNNVVIQIVIALVIVFLTVNIFKYNNFTEFMASLIMVTFLFVIFQNLQLNTINLLNAIILIYLFFMTVDRSYLSILI